MWSNAGLPEPIVVPPDGPARFLEMNPYALPPGASPRSAYLEASYSVRGGETLVFVTDGLVEVRPADGSGEEFGYDRLLQFLSENRPGGPQRLVESIARRLADYRGDANLEDDLTIVAVQIDSPKGV